MPFEQILHITLRRHREGGGAFRGDAAETHSHNLRFKIWSSVMQKQAAVCEIEKDDCHFKVWKEGVERGGGGVMDIFLPFKRCFSGG